MADVTAALAAIEAANKARGDVWASLHLAGTRLGYDPPRLGIARQALADALEACDGMQAAIIAARAALPPPGEASGEARSGS